MCNLTVADHPETHISEQAPVLRTILAWQWTVSSPQARRGNGWQAAVN
jgi:hypothetical protein